MLGKDLALGGILSKSNDNGNIANIPAFLQHENGDDSLVGRFPGIDLVGLLAQELKLLDGEKVIWSSDDCNARHGSDVRKFAPDDALAFTLTWDGRRSRSGTGATNCTTAPVPAIGTYALQGRLETAVSPAVAISLT